MVFGKNYKPYRFHIWLNYIRHILKTNDLYFQEYFMIVLMVKILLQFFKKDKGWVICLAIQNFLKSEPEYAYKRYAYKENMYKHINWSNLVEHKETNLNISRYIKTRAK